MFAISYVFEYAHQLSDLFSYFFTTELSKVQTSVHRRDPGCSGCNSPFLNIIPGGKRYLINHSSNKHASY